MATANRSTPATATLTRSSSSIELGSTDDTDSFQLRSGDDSLRHYSHSQSAAPRSLTLLPSSTCTYLHPVTHPHTHSAPNNPPPPPGPSSSSSSPSSGPGLYTLVGGYFGDNLKLVTRVLAARARLGLPALWLSKEVSGRCVDWGVSACMHVWVGGCNAMSATRASKGCMLGPSTRTLDIHQSWVAQALALCMFPCLRCPLVPYHHAVPPLTCRLASWPVPAWALRWAVC